jgi:hypothetical protein
MKSILSQGEAGGWLVLSLRTPLDVHGIGTLRSPRLTHDLSRVRGQLTSVPELRGSAATALER